MTMCVRFADAAPSPLASSNFGFVVIGVITFNIAINMSIFVSSNAKLLYLKVKGIVQRCKEPSSEDDIVKIQPEGVDMTVDITLIAQQQPKQQLSIQKDQRDDSFVDTIENEGDFSKSEVIESVPSHSQQQPENQDGEAENQYSEPENQDGDPDNQDYELENQDAEREESFEGIDHDSDLDDE